jgi:hypothetical protein
MKVGDLKALPLKVLIYSRAGMGKTALALTLGGDVDYIDMDDNLEVAFGLMDEFRDTRLGATVHQFLDNEPNKATAFAKVKKYLQGVQADCHAKKFPFKAVCLDSLTSLAAAAQRMIMHNSGMAGQNPQIQHWGMILNEIENIVTLLRSLPVVVFVLAHQTTFTSDNVSEIQISIPGQKLPGRITRMFNEIWYFRVRALGQGQQEFYIQTVPTSDITCRSGRGLATGTRFGGMDKSGKPLKSVGLWDIMEKIQRKETQTVS